MSNVLQRSLGQTSAQKSWAIMGKFIEYNELRHTPTQPVSATIAEIQLLVDVTRTTYYIRRCQRASITKQVMHTSHGLHPSSQCQPQLPKSNYSLMSHARRTTYDLQHMTKVKKRTNRRCNLNHGDTHPPSQCQPQLPKSTY